MQSPDKGLNQPGEVSNLKDKQRKVNHFRPKSAAIPGMVVRQQMYKTVGSRMLHPPEIYFPIKLHESSQYFNNTRV